MRVYACAAPVLYSNLTRLACPATTDWDHDRRVIVMSRGEQGLAQRSVSKTVPRAGMQS